MGDEAAEDAERLQPALRSLLVAHDDRCRRTVRELAGIAGGDAEAFTTHRLQTRETFGRGLRTRAFILRERHVLERDIAGRLVGDRHLRGDRRQLVLELAALLGGGDTALALQ